MTFNVIYSCNGENTTMPVTALGDITKEQAERFAQVGIEDYNKMRNANMPEHKFLYVEGDFVERSVEQDLPTEKPLEATTRKKSKK